MAAHLKYRFNDFKFVTKTPTIVTCGMKHLINSFKKKDREGLNMRVWPLESRCGGTYALTLNDRSDETHYLAMRQFQEILDSRRQDGWSPRINVTTILGMRIPAVDKADPKKLYKDLTAAVKDADYTLAQGTASELLQHLQMVANVGELGFRMEFSSPPRSIILSPVAEGAKIPFLDTILEWYKPTRLFYRDVTRMDKFERPHIEGFWPNRDMSYHDRLAEGAALAAFCTEKRKLLEASSKMEGPKA